MSDLSNIKNGLNGAQDIASVKVTPWGEKDEDGIRRDCFWNIAKEQAEQEGRDDITNVMNEIIEYNNELAGDDNTVSAESVIYTGEQVYLPLKYAMDEIEGCINDALDIEEDDDIDTDTLASYVVQLNALKEGADDKQIKKLDELINQIAQKCPEAATEAQQEKNANDISTALDSIKEFDGGDNLSTRELSRLTDIKTELGIDVVDGSKSSISVDKKTGQITETVTHENGKTETIEYKINEDGSLYTQHSLKSGESEVTNFTCHYEDGQMTSKEGVWKNTDGTKRCEYEFTYQYNDEGVRESAILEKWGGSSYENSTKEEAHKYDIVYNEDGSEKERTETIKDEDGNLVSKGYFDDIGRQRSLHGYNDKGDVVKQEYYNVETGKVQEKIEFFRDEQGNLTQRVKTEYEPTNSAFETVVYTDKFDSNGNRTRVTDCYTKADDAHPTQTDYWTYKDANDDKSCVLTQTDTFDAKSGKINSKTLFENNKVTQSNTYQYDQSSGALVKETIKKYDSEERITSYVKKDAEGNIKYELEYSYSQDGVKSFKGASYEYEDYTKAEIEGKYNKDGSCVYERRCYNGDTLVVTEKVEEDKEGNENIVESIISQETVQSAPSEGSGSTTPTVSTAPTTPTVPAPTTPTTPTAPTAPTTPATPTAPTAPTTPATPTTPTTEAQSESSPMWNAALSENAKSYIDKFNDCENKNSASTLLDTLKKAQNLTPCEKVRIIEDVCKENSNVSGFVEKLIGNTNTRKGDFYLSIIKDMVADDSYSINDIIEANNRLSEVAIGLSDKAEGNFAKDSNVWSNKHDLLISLYSKAQTIDDIKKIENLGLTSLPDLATQVQVNYSFGNETQKLTKLLEAVYNSNDSIPEQINKTTYNIDKDRIDTIINNYTELSYHSYGPRGEDKGLQLLPLSTRVTRVLTDYNNGNLAPNEALYALQEMSGGDITKLMKDGFRSMTNDAQEKYIQSLYELYSTNIG